MLKTYKYIVMNDMDNTTKDYFSKQAQDYAKYRPNYPVELFQYLSSLTNEHEIAWDCATGNGQAAIQLAKFYTKVIATDLSAKQIEHATQNDKVTFYQADCEHSGLADHSIDIITAAQAAHWFNMSLFEEECRRVIKPNGIVAFWMYNLFRINPEIDAIIDDYYWNILKGYWPEGRENIDQEYKNVNLNLERLNVPLFEMEKEWDFDQVIGYLSSWSSLQNYVKINNSNPIDIIKQSLAKAWGELDDTKEVSWPMKLKVYRI
jgi:ubiquinone/menaquinone biosynthesis C-methylase UbiE